MYLAQHVILLHTVDFSKVDLPLERVLKELSANVEEHRADRTFLQGATRRSFIMVAGGGNAIPQNNAHQQTCPTHRR